MDTAGSFQRIRPAAVAGSFYPGDPDRLTEMIDAQLDYARRLLNQRDERQSGAPQERQPWPKAVIVPHAGYIYSGTTAALAYALLERGRGTIRRAVIVGPTHRVAVRGVACCSADAFATPLGVVPVDVDAERRALGCSELRSGIAAADDAPASAMIVNDPTHRQEHAVEVQIPFLQRVCGNDISVVPLNAGLASPEQVGDVLRALWGGPETVIVISSDLSHYHPEHTARELDDETIRRVSALDYPIDSDRACGAYPINGLLDVLARGTDAVCGSNTGYSTDTGGGVDTDRGTGAASSGGAVRGVETARSGAIARSADAGSGATYGSSMADENGTSISSQTPSPQSERMELEFLGCCTSGDSGQVALAGRDRPPMDDPSQRVVGYASWAVWTPSTESEAEVNA